jgi:hypothetical protein
VRSSSSSKSESSTLRITLASDSASRANCLRNRCCDRARSSVKRTRRSIAEGSFALRAPSRACRPSMASGAVTASQGRRHRHELNPFACVEAQARVGDGSRAAVEATANRASTLSKHAVTEHKLFRYLTPPDPPLPPYRQSEGSRLSVDSSSGVRQYLRTYCSQARGDLVCGLGTRSYSPWQSGPGSSWSWFRYQQIEGWRPRGTPRDPAEARISARLGASSSSAQPIRGGLTRGRSLGAVA